MLTRAREVGVLREGLAFGAARGDLVVGREVAECGLEVVVLEGPLAELVANGVGDDLAVDVAGLDIAGVEGLEVRALEVGLVGERERLVLGVPVGGGLVGVDGVREVVEVGLEDLGELELKVGAPTELAPAGEDLDGAVQRVAGLGGRRAGLEGLEGLDVGVAGLVVVAGLDLAGRGFEEELAGGLELAAQLIEVGSLDEEVCGLLI